MIHHIPHFSLGVGPTAWELFESSLSIVNNEGEEKGMKRQVRISISYRGLEAEQGEAGGAHRLASVLAAAKNVEICELGLSFNRIGQAELDFLLPMLLGPQCRYSLCSLRLSRCALDDECMAIIASQLVQDTPLPFLEILCLNRNDISEVGATAFFEALALNGSLTVVELDYNHIDNPWLLASIDNLVYRNRHNKRLLSLSLFDCLFKAFFSPSQRQKICLLSSRSPGEVEFVSPSEIE